MDYSHIINLSAAELYSRAIDFLNARNYNNFITHITMSANYNYEPAEELLSEEGSRRTYQEDFSCTRSFYETTKDMKYSAHILGYLYIMGLKVQEDRIKGIELLKRAIEKGNVDAFNFLSVVVVSFEEINKYKIALINYLIENNQFIKIKNIKGSDEQMIEFIMNNKKLEKENKELRKEIEELKTHIMASPEGELYFEAKESWSKQLQNV